MEEENLKKIFKLKNEMENRILTRNSRKRYREQINDIYSKIGEKYKVDYMDNIPPPINDDPTSMPDSSIPSTPKSEQSNKKRKIDKNIKTKINDIKEDIIEHIADNTENSNNVSISIDVDSFAEYLSGKVLENIFKKIQVVDEDGKLLDNDILDEDYVEVESVSVGTESIGSKDTIENMDKYKKMIGTLNQRSYKYFCSLKEKEKDKLFELFNEISNYNKNDTPAKIKGLGLDLDLASKSTIVDKIDKLDTIEPGDSEFFKIKKWVDASLRIPFGIYKPLPVKKRDPIAKIKKFMNNIRKNLNKCIYGQDEAKDKIVQIIGQWISNPNSKGQIIGLCGPPGVGKTSIIKEGLAKCLDIPFGFLALGGAHDESLLVGHSETYVGSTWGRIADILMKSKCMNPIIMLDELDKISNRRGESDEISGVLTHLTDPSQNKEFNDNYFGNVNLDLSKALFIFSYNDISKINPILRDRIMNINFSGFTPLEKINITQNYLLPRIIKDVGFKKKDISIDDRDILYVIESYTYENGVRKLNEKLYEIIRAFNIEYLKKKNGQLPFKITRKYIQKIFDTKDKIRRAIVADVPQVGVVAGLYADGVNGGITVIETKKIPFTDKMGVVMTGSLGKVMKESVSCAKTVVWNLLSEKEKKKLDAELKKRSFGFHINCHEAAVEKEGPSAGVTITTAIYSLLTGKKVRNNIAMTGEIDLNGNIHEIGGLENKLYGAKQAGVKLAFVPKANEETFLRLKRKYEELGEECIEVRCVKHITEILDEVFV